MSALLAEDSSLLHCSLNNPSAQPELYISQICHGYTGKKEKKIFLIYKEIKKGSGSKSHRTIAASSYMTKYVRISSYMTLHTSEFPCI